MPDRQHGNLPAPQRADNQQRWQAEALTALIGSIPKELQRVPHWVVWNYEHTEGRGGKPSKVPYNPHSRSHSSPWRASVNKPRSWGTFGQALRALSSGGYTGIGFVFSETDPFCGVDLDNCIDEQEELTAWATEIVRTLNTYSEWSPSRKGVHLIVRAALPVAGMNRKDQGLEIYSSRRFFTISGLRLPGTSPSIEGRQEEIMALYQRYNASSSPAQQEATRPLPTTTGRARGAPTSFSSHPHRRIRTPDDLTDDELIERAMAAVGRYGKIFVRLWRGDRSLYRHTNGEHAGEIDASRADLALCSMLAFWTGKNAARIDTLFRKSGLMRPKWDQPARTGESYGQGTIRRAIEGTSRIYDPTWKPHPRPSGTHARNTEKKTTRGRGPAHGHA